MAIYFLQDCVEICAVDIYIYVDICYVNIYIWIYIFVDICDVYIYLSGYIYLWMYIYLCGYLRRGCFNARLLCNLVCNGILLSMFRNQTKHLILVTLFRLIRAPSEILFAMPN